MTPREVALAYLAAFDTADPDDIAARVTDDFVNEHTAAIGSGCEGRAAYRERLPAFLGSFSGLTYEVADPQADVVADGDRVIVAYTLHADWLGKTPVTIRGVQRLRIADGLVAHRVDYWDSLTFLLQVDPTLADTLAAWL